MDRNTEGLMKRSDRRGNWWPRGHAWNTNTVLISGSDFLFRSLSHTYALFVCTTKGKAKAFWESPGLALLRCASSFIIHTTKNGFFSLFKMRWRVYTFLIFDHRLQCKKTHSNNFYYYSANQNVHWKSVPIIFDFKTFFLVSCLDMAMSHTRYPSGIIRQTDKHNWSLFVHLFGRRIHVMQLVLRTFTYDLYRLQITWYGRFIISHDDSCFLNSWSQCGLTLWYGANFSGLIFKRFAVSKTQDVCLW